MEINTIVAGIDAELARLRQARELLTGTNGHHAPQVRIKRSVMSAEGRARIAAAQRKRWAKQKKKTA